ncbi:MAG TPA: TIGR00730 family Rossman fold protein [Alphaproteobacteria bacterium]
MTGQDVSGTGDSGRAGRSVGLFCSAAAKLPEFMIQAAREFGAECARRRWRLVYGGSRNGLMGEAATAALAAGGDVVGVMPHFLVAREAAKRDITELHLVDTLAERKEMMIELADIFVCLPGGIGTLDELLEVLTTNDLGRHEKPIYLCNIDGFWTPFDAMIAALAARGVMRPRGRDGYRLFADVPSLMEGVAAHFARR